MHQNDRATQRRRGLRFEIIGRLQGTVATVEPLHVVNISAGGALVQAAFALPVNSLHVVRLGSEASLGTLDVRVCHATPAPDAGRFLLGLEFVTPDALATRQVADFVTNALNTPPPA